MPLDLTSLRVPKRARHLDVDVVMQMERASLDADLPGISRSLVAAIDAAEEHVPAQLRQDAVYVLRKAFKRARMNPDAWVGAVTACYGAMLAAFAWKHIDADVVQELTWRWDEATSDHFNASIDRVQLRELGAALGVAS